MRRSPRVPLAWAVVEVLTVVAVLAGVTEVLGCSSSSGPADDPASPENPGAPDSVRQDPSGNLPAAFEAEYAFTYADLNLGTSRTELCSGTLALGGDRDRLFGGTFAVHVGRDCPAPASGALSGRLLELGDLELDLQVEGSDPNEFPDLTGCAYITQGGRFSGALNAKKLAANNRSTAYCIDSIGTIRTVELRIRIDGRRTSSSGSDSAIAPRPAQATADPQPVSPSEPLGHL
ncbi:MAG: hypothetical protein H0V09_01260 [Gemmatimonadetes bacterium]|nr:hypothetical protein [Gemmatimonadota bacterium]